MKLTSKGRYAVTAMLDIAINQSKGPITLAMISERQDISLSYLEQIFAKLKKSDLVLSARGPGGGYRLSRDPGEISVSEVIAAVNEDLEARKCKGRENCKGGEECLSHELWSDLSEMIEQFLENITLQKIIEKRSSVKEIIFA
ncbi:MULTISPECIES: Rrf2 family transcriptional regulator [Hydrogenovibrio]|jgi:Rrf2 family iron-sulfur cluster assembly transcriptional regulator|uniref:[Fe-S]-binding protein n=1 Tax=Hydrogenovibrio marinus TaxID=28885 RepID=A0A066ZSW5_HYDMR|nr:MULTISPECIES: Rrf2 family transcriptional regulator [Hydrogenovibrio]MBD3820646.1 Rrf2 family transcriptional regulator [Thiotrichales bacterium]KDN96903.1 [Fe-S]-binding protein [Hydrogenovibrio marinus]MBN2606067.1 Rrf2 family transcriptional regulator [Thiotrichales bacterium]MPQ75620.1 Rrf2 family transcriptional regulator [Hydrogenovibrio sp. JE_KL2]BBN59162.1 putative HTH-type transcriptional regulator [Hydrogenovibrio marinus]